MRLNGLPKINSFKEKHPQSRANLNAWVAEMKEGDFKNPHDIKAMYPSTDFLGNGNAIFNISGNNFRLWVQIMYKFSLVYIRKVGTHKEYEKWKIQQ